MKKIVIMPGGFHPFHAGHAALYQSAVKAFPDAEVYVAASNDTKTRPFPFAIKEKLAKLAGVAPGHFVQVKSPFQSQEITSHYNPNEDVLIFVRSEKDRNESPKPGGTKKDGSPSYYQPWTGKDLQPFSKHAYMAYLPTVEFGPGIKSATEIRNAWPKLNEKRKLAMVMSLYPATQKNPKLAANVVKMLDMGMGNELAEGSNDPWGDQGNFAGDTPVNLGGDTVKQLGIGDIVTYLGQRAKIVGMSRDKTISRITIEKGMGSVTQDVRTSNLKRTGMAEADNAGAGFGPGYPGTYEEENKPFTHKGGYRTTSLTYESVDYIDEK
jgi:hypothetical protein